MLCPAYCGGPSLPQAHEEAVLPLLVLAQALFLSSEQQAVREAAANEQSSHQSFGQGSEPHRLSPGWPCPHTQPAGAPPVCQGHCLPGPCCALIGRPLCARLGGRCWALLRPRLARGDLDLGAGPGDLGVESVLHVQLGLLLSLRH